LHLSLLVPFLIDVVYFRKITYTVYNFIKWNVIDNNSRIFGTKEFDYYVKRTYPNFFNEQFPFLKAGIFLIIFDIVQNILKNFFFKNKIFKLEQKNIC
jgi:hypothetical protein